jgi:hypothetical protein
MENTLVTARDVMTWITESLGDGVGRFEVQDLTFVKKSVKVVTVRRDSCFELASGRWPQLAEPEGRSALTQELRGWARRCLPQA